MPVLEITPTEQSGRSRPNLRRILRGIFRTAASTEVALPALEATQPEPEKVDPAPLIEKAAANVGTKLEPARLAELVEMVTTDPRVARGVYKDDKRGLAIASPFPGEDGKTSSELHFLPSTKKAEWANTAQTREAVKVGYDLLTGLQNYALLADAGLLKPADELRGYKETNPEMARVARHYGFETDGGEVWTSFQAVHDLVLSPRMVAFEEKLSQRLATINHGQSPSVPPPQ